PYENTVRFNDRFFSHGGTTRGVLQLKSSTNQSQAALDMFKREWKNTLSGINGAWQIPVVNAEDVKFVYMTPTARDMEFESWLNFL
ncbi:chromosome partitioning protein ParB, partial [Salmonella enterica subsp. enterica serovar Typhimurium]|uniref:phage portal protein n=1 Tax=Salmonella enterica TaxID=28901 RepID=UPI000CC3B640